MEKPNLDEWLSGKGPEEDIVFCTRVRLARNIEGFRFSAMQDEDEALELTLVIRKALAAQIEEQSWTWCDLKDESALNRQVLMERHLISREIELAERSRGVLHDARGTSSLMINEEDHIRLQIFRAGLRMEEAWDVADKLDDEIASSLPYAYASKFGFLTSCPTNTGTGLRISVMLHLPALVLAKEIDKAATAIQEMNMTVRGLFGEGSQAVGDLFQISNQKTLGDSEQEVLDGLKTAVLSLIDWEKKQRAEFLANPLFLEDRAQRAYGIFRRARLISSEESINLLSRLRLGRIMGLIDEPPLEDLNRIFLLTQPGHLQLSEGGELPPQERDRIRAEWIRRILD